MSKLKLTRKARILLAFLLAFGPIFLVSDFAHANKLDPDQTLSNFQQQLAIKQATLAEYTNYYNQYSPSNISDLNSASSAVQSFSSEINSYSQLIAPFNSASASLATAQAPVDSYQSDLQSASDSLDLAQTAYDTAQTNYNEGITPEYLSAVQARDDAYSAYQATIANSNLLEEFAGGQITSGMRFTLNGLDNPILLNSGNPQLQNGRIFVDQYGQDLYVQPPVGATATTLGFETYARNGNQTITVTFTDNTTATFTNPNGVNNPNCPGYYCNVSYTAPEGKAIQSYVIPGDFDILYLDKFTFSSNSYDPTAYQEYLDAESALAPLQSEVDSLQQIASSSATTLQNSQALFDLISSEAYLQGLEAQRDQAQTNFDSALASLASQYEVTVLAEMLAQDELDAVVLPPTSLVVTSLADTTDEGTLRWAISQANATQGGYSDKITFSVSGTITLTSDLPRISQNLTIEGPGEANLTISGDDLYQILYINQNISLTASNLTLSDGKQTSGGQVRLERALEFNSSNMTFRGQNGGSAVFIGNSGVATYTNATFTNNGIGIAADWGSTPQLPAGVTTWADQPDTVFQNRTYVYNSTFTNNGQAIMSYRFTEIHDSYFSGNTYAANITGLNRTHIKNSVFENNGIAYYNNVWMPTTFNMGTDNRLIQDNTFKNNETAIYNDDGFNNGQKFPGWSTYLNNTFINNSNNVVYYKWDGTVNQYNRLQVTLTTSDFVLTGSIVPVIEPPTNVVATINEDYSVTVTWDAPQTQDTTVERYAIFFYAGQQGWAVSSTETQVTISPETFESTGGLDVTYDFKVRADNDTETIYSAFSEPVVLEVPAEPQPEPTPSPTPNPEPKPEPQPVQPAPEPSPTPEPSPVEPEPTPTPEVTPEPSPSETPPPTPTPSEPETVEPEPQPSTPILPEEEPSLEPEPEVSTPVEPEDTELPEEPAIEPEEPSEPPVVEPEEEPITSVEDLPEEITPEVLMDIDLEEIDPLELSEGQVEALIEAALETFETAEQGSEEYEQALDALFVAAQADDIVLDESLAAIPLVGDVLGGAVELVNFLGNAGSDMSPEVREDSERVVVAAVIVGQIALMATSNATMVVAMNART